jgi:hypothetical protein
MSSPRRRLYDAEPEIFGSLRHLEELAQVHRFRDEAVGGDCRKSIASLSAVPLL